MKKKLVLFASLFLVLTLGILSTKVHADELTIINPKDKTVSMNNVILVSGKGEEGTKLKIDTYLANLLSNEKVDLENPPQGGYILVVSEGVEIGATGNFACEIPLSKGLNKIQVKSLDSNETEEIYVYITDLKKARAELSSVNGAKFTHTLRALMK